jgi:predicted MPP superfamily phosphohydrolase
MARKIITAAIIFLLLSICIWYNTVSINCRTFQIREETIRSSKIDDDSDGFLIACFSDLYYGNMISDDLLKEVCQTIDSFDPDVIIFEGDLLYPGIELSEEKIVSLNQILSSLDARHGKYAVYGDQDHLDIEKVNEILLGSGFEPLDNLTKLISIDRNSYINISGIDSLVAGDPDVTKAFSGANANYFTFAVSHCPDIFDSVLGYSVDFLSAGHSRGGQIYIPLISYFTREYGCKKYYRGKVTKNAATLDINNGIGRYVNDARFLADAEIVLYTLRPVR